MRSFKNGDGGGYGFGGDGFGDGFGSGGWDETGDGPGSLG